MLKERSHQRRPASDLCQLREHARIEGLALLQRTPGSAGTLGVAPDQFVGIEVRRIARQVMQRQLAVEARDILRHPLGLVCWQTVQDQLQGPATTAHHLAQQRDEQVAIQTTGIRWQTRMHPWN